jgi:Tfp pilus assembly protein FimT
MLPRRLPGSRWDAGLSAAELIVVCAIIGILAAASAPFFLSYYQNAQLKAGAEEVVAFLNQARQIAIKENQSVCASIDSNRMRYHLGTCSGTVWVGPGTDAAGNIRIPEGLTLTTSAEPIFNYLGAAAPAATFTVTNPRNGRSLSVAVSASGRVTIGP